MTVTTRRLAGLCAAVLGLTLWTGCTPTEPGPTSSPSAPVTTAAPSSTPTESEAERDMRLDFEAAEKSYRTFFEEFHRILRAGGAKNATAKFKSVAGGPTAKRGKEIIQGYRKNRSREVGRFKVLSVEPNLYKTESVTLTTCEDARKVYNVDSKGKRVTGEGELRRLEVSVMHVKNDWKVWKMEATTVKTVKKCMSSD